MVKVYRWHLHTLATPGRCSDSTGLCELSKTFDTVHNGERK